MPRITPFLWFDGKAEEAARFYVSIFKNSKMMSVSRYGDAGPGPKGTVMTVSFQLDGQEFIALNGGPQFTFTEAISLLVNCETQDDVDALWEKLSAGGEQGPVRLAERQIWAVLADHSHGLRQDAARPGPQESAESHERDAADEQDRYPASQAGVQSGIACGDFATSPPA
jgi:predicted 3-demethylubiquinone-9 3-methyltransferase (glyoxalase superfamily)